MLVSAVSKKKSLIKIYETCPYMKLDKEISKTERTKNDQFSDYILLKSKINLTMTVYSHNYNFFV